LIHLIAAAGLLAGLAGCSDGPVVSRADVQQPAPDSLVVTASFATSSGLFGRAIVPDSVYATAYDAQSRPLGRASSTTGAPLRLGVRDDGLGSKEHISIEVCGRTERGTVCEPLAARSSAKRYSATLDVDYPLGGSRDRAGYAVQWRAERMRPDSTWERFNLLDLPRATLGLATEDQPTARVQVPLTETEGALDLVRAEGHSDFWFALRQALQTADRTTVRAELRLETGELIASDTLVVRELSQRERYAVAASFAESAVFRVLDRLEAPRDGRVGWRMVSTRYDALQNRYQTLVQVEWRGGNIFDRDHYVADIRITHAEDGASASATLVDASGDLRAIWDARAGGSSIRLGTLERQGMDDQQGIGELDPDAGEPTARADGRRDRDDLRRQRRHRHDNR
jgi:hypothetical protein